MSVKARRALRGRLARLTIENGRKRRTVQRGVRRKEAFAHTVHQARVIGSVNGIVIPGVLVHHIRKAEVEGQLEFCLLAGLCLGQRQLIALAVLAAERELQELRALLLCGIGRPGKVHRAGL